VLVEVSHAAAAAEAVASGVDAIYVDTFGDYALAAVSNDDLIAAGQVRSAYAGLKLDLADGLGVVIADRYRTNRIFTLDLRDFRAITPLTPGFDSFIILPADAG